MSSPTTKIPSITSSSHQPKRRVITPARREQNRAAQRAYRERQREHQKSFVPRGKLRKLVPRNSSISTSEKSSCFNSSSRPSSLHQTSFSTQVASDGTQQSPSIGHEESSKVCQHNLPATQHHRQKSNLLNIEKNSMSSVLSMKEIISQPEQSLDLLDTEILTGEEFTPAHVDQGKFNDGIQDLMSSIQSPSTGFSNIPGATSIHSKRTDSLSRPLYIEDTCHQAETESIKFADPVMNTLQPSYTTTKAAVLANALCLGFDLEKLTNCKTTYMSPFFQPITEKKSPQALVASTFSTSIPVHLQPTMAQILIPHHASLDLIPLPLFRERAIMMSFAMPDVFDLWDLKLDIYIRDALVCRRHRPGDACQPWNKKSWEGMPWFWTKWGMAT